MFGVTGQAELSVSQLVGVPGRDDKSESPRDRRSLFDEWLTPSGISLDIPIPSLPLGSHVK
jgi:hypothetical protein